MGNMEKLTENLSILETSTGLVEGFEPKGSGEKNYYIRGKFATIEAVNNNRRFYPRHLWEREVAKYQDEIKNGTINTLMEWDHPKDRLEVDPSKAIGKITKLWIEGDYVMGEAVIFDTPMAETLKSMIKHGVQISVSSRARGRTDNAGVVQEFNLITFDFVAKPSDRSATMYGIFEKEMSELFAQDNEKGHLMDNDSMLESLVNMVRTKDTIISDLKDEIAILRSMHEGDVQTAGRDGKHDGHAGFANTSAEEDAEYGYRRAGEGLTQTHRHQDVAYLNDTDPASSAYSGEKDIMKIARLLASTFGRDNVVGSVLGNDLDTGNDLNGKSADVELQTRPAIDGYDPVSYMELKESRAQRYAEEDEGLSESETNRFFVPVHML